MSHSWYKLLFTDSFTRHGRLATLFSILFTVRWYYYTLSHFFNWKLPAEICSLHIQNLNLLFVFIFFKLLWILLNGINRHWTFFCLFVWCLTTHQTVLIDIEPPLGHFNSLTLTLLLTLLNGTNRHWGHFNPMTLILLNVPTDTEPLKYLLLIGTNGHFNTF